MQARLRALDLHLLSFSTRSSIRKFSHQSVSAYGHVSLCFRTNVLLRLRNFSFQYLRGILPLHLCSNAPSRFALLRYRASPCEKYGLLYPSICTSLRICCFALCCLCTSVSTIICVYLHILTRDRFSAYLLKPTIDSSHFHAYTTPRLYAYLPNVRFVLTYGSPSEVQCVVL